MKYRKNYKRRSDLSRKIIASGLSVVFSAGVFSGCAQATYYVENEVLTGEILANKTEEIYKDTLNGLKKFVPKRLDGILKIILGENYESDKEKYTLSKECLDSRETLLDIMYEDFKGKEVKVDAKADDPYSFTKDPETVCAERAFNEYFTKENIHKWIKENFLKKFPNLIKEKEVPEPEKYEIDNPNELENEEKHEEYENLENEEKDEGEDQFKENDSSLENEKKTSCSKTVIIFVIVACLFTILVIIGLISYFVFVTGDSDSDEIKSNEDSSKNSEQSGQNKSADTGLSKDQKKENETAQMQHTGGSNAGKWVAGAGVGTLLASFFAAAGIYAKNSANFGILNKPEASAKTEPIGLKDNKIDEIGSENDYTILKDNEGHSTQTGEKTGDVKNNEEEGVKTKR